MFTGIVESNGRVREIVPLDRGIRVCLSAPGFIDTPWTGESVAVNGVCLTLVQCQEDQIEFEAVEETLDRTTLGDLKPGMRVNLERPVSLDTRLGGHLVQGHVDGVGTVLEVEERGVENWITLRVPKTLVQYIVEKGSIALDGVSMTVAAIEGSEVSVAVIPHTTEVTTLGDWVRGSRVNIEVDMLAKYIEKLVAPYLASRS